MDQYCNFSRVKFILDNLALLRSEYNHIEYMKKILLDENDFIDICLLKDTIFMDSNI